MRKQLILTLDDTARIIDEHAEDWQKITTIAKILFGETPANMPRAKAVRLAVLKADCTLKEFRQMIKTITDNN